MLNQKICLPEIFRLRLEEMTKFPANFAIMISYILRAHRGEPDSSLPANLDIGIKPCRWCGLDRCKTKLNTTTVKEPNSKERHQIALITMQRCNCQYRAAEISTPRKPCTNLPIHCPVCPSRLNGQPQTF